MKHRPLFTSQTQLQLRYTTFGSEQQIGQRIFANVFHAKIPSPISHRQFDKHETQFSWMAFVKFDLSEVTHSNRDQEPVYDGAYTSCVWHARRGCKSMHDFCYYNLSSNFTSVGYCFYAIFFAKLLLSLIRTLFVWNVWHVTIHKKKMWIERKRERDQIYKSPSFYRSYIIRVEAKLQLTLLAFYGFFRTHYTFTWCEYWFDAWPKCTTSDLMCFE